MFYFLTVLSTRPCKVASNNLFVSVAVHALFLSVQTVCTLKKIYLINLIHISFSNNLVKSSNFAGKSPVYILNKAHLSPTNFTSPWDV